MHNTAAYWTDCLFPGVPVRQWVLSLPWELRLLAAARPAVVTALGRIFVKAVFEHYRKVAGRPDSQGGAALSLHRAGDSLNLNPHFHGLAMDGVFIRDDEQAAVRFQTAPSPSPAELAAVVTRIRDRALHWLSRHGYLERSLECGDSALLSCAQLALGGSQLGRLDHDSQLEQDADTTRFRASSGSPFAVALDGFNLHAAVTVEAEDDASRERLARIACDLLLHSAA